MLRYRHVRGHHRCLMNLADQRRMMSHGRLYLRRNAVGHRHGMRLGIGIRSGMRVRRCLERAWAVA